MISNARLLIALVLVTLAALVAAALLPQHYGLGGAAVDLCGEPGASGCDAVNQSAWSELAGFPVAAVGLLFYALLAALLGLAAAAGDASRPGLAALALAGLGAGLLVDLGLLAVQAFAIGAYCPLCLGTYALGLGAFVALWPARRGAGVLARLPGDGEGRVSLVGLGIAAIAVSAGVAALVLQMQARRALRDATMLGSPLAAGPSTPTEPTSEHAGAVAPDASAEAPEASTEDAIPGGEAGGVEDIARYRREAEAAQAEARRLKEILDDPQKLEAYRSDESVAQFEAAGAEPIDLGSSPFKGPENAPVKIVEYSDFLCPYCRSLAGALSGYLPQTEGRVAIHFKHYPLDPSCSPAVERGGHPGACALAMGAICAQEQGKFWPYHDRVYAADLHEAGIPDVLRIGDEAGLDRTALERCVVAPATRQRLDREIAEGREADVTGTPTLFVNGKRLPRINDLVRIVGSELERLGLPPLAAPR